MIDRTELQDSVRRAFEGGPLPADESWRTIADLGLLMTTVPEAKGGLGLGSEALAAINFELGRALVRGPAIAHALVVEALAASDRTDLLEAAMAGQMMTAAHFACDADAASHVLFSDGDAVKLVPRDLVQTDKRPTWDRTRRFFEVTATGDGMIIARGEAAAVLNDRAEARLCLMLAADSLGGANAVLEMTVEYLKTRRQFDRPLAMFQALKHRAADMKAALSAAEALLWQRAADDRATLSQMGALKAHTCGVYRDIAEEAIQLHGGIGLTAEHPCHLFLKRALLNCAAGGDADRWQERAGRELLAAG